MKKRVIFICAHNSARSIMAEAILKHLYNEKYEVYSAGTNPSEVKELTRIVLRKLSIFSRRKKYIHKSFEDPKTLEDFRRVRDEIYSWIKDFFYRLE